MDFRRPSKKRPMVRERVIEESDDETEVGHIAQLSRTKLRKVGKTVNLNAEEDARQRQQKALGLDISVPSNQVANIQYEQSRSIAISHQDDEFNATDSTAQFERVQEALKSGIDINDGIYRGRAFYGAEIKKDTIKGKASSMHNRIGPVRENQFMKSSVRFDYAPDVCKDYKETGFCTFGDSCKFLHDRGDYKHGWEIDRDWDAQQKNGVAEENYEIGSDEDKDAMECGICEGTFVNPIATKCGHYFCQKCAMDRYRKDKNCASCGQDTDGTFKIAKDLVKKLKLLKDQEAEQAKVAEEEEEEVDESCAEVEETTKHDQPSSLNENEESTTQSDDDPESDVEGNANEEEIVQESISDVEESTLTDQLDDDDQSDED
uniref:Pre-mRNA-splicing factor CWC24 n=1 Tax=Rhabditophanes sp. KR3021 TaxID=114890 RepID=A0AC35U037_9BILA